MNNKVSIIIPSRNERFLSQTVDDIFKNAAGEIEVIPVLDGYWPDPILTDRPNLMLIHRGKPLGMRAAINAAASVAKGRYLMKCDAHCAFDQGFDEILKRDCAEEWLMIPRRYSLDAEAWARRDKAPVDYHYVDCPMVNPEYFQFHGMIWPEQDRKLAQVEVDDTPSWQGSMWFMHRSQWDRFGPMSEVGYGSFSQEPQELGMKFWLSGGAIKVNKRTWYAHLHKGKQWGRMYHMNMAEVKAGHIYSAWYWFTNQWSERKLDIEWFIEKFMPMPGWPANWRELLQQYQATHKDHS